MGRGQIQLPTTTIAALAQLSDALKAGRVDQTILAIATAELEALRPRDVIRAEQALGRLLPWNFAPPAALSKLWFGVKLDDWMLWARRNLAQIAPEKTRFRLLRPVYGSSANMAAIENKSGLALVLSFHRNGYVRETALRWIDELPTPFHVAALAQRLNDWAEEVRAVAASRASELFPKASPHVLAVAASELLSSFSTRKRWGPERTLLDAVMSRSDVIQEIASIAMDGRYPIKAVLLRHIAATSEFDAYLACFTSSRLPLVRAHAYKSLIQGESIWRTATERRWTDEYKQYFRMVPVYARRKIERPDTIETLIRRAAADPSRLVRKTAADCMIKFPETVSLLSDVLDRLASDASPAIRERIDFIRRKLTPT